MLPVWARSAARGIHNYVRSYPVCVSIEVTHGCTAACEHCNLGGLLPDERRASPEDYARLLRAAGSPPYVQISGGEPLSRPDIYDVVRAVRGAGALPVIIFVSNGSLLDPEKYQRLRDAGINRISISLDFPDERHDEFRRSPGLFQHLSTVLPQIAKQNGGGCNVALNTAITKANFPYVVEIAHKAREWGVGVSYSAYTTTKNGDTSLMLSANDTRALDTLMDELIELQARGLNILNPPSLLKKTIQFFTDGQIPHCGAGKRFLVIRPDGTLIPCSSFQDARYPSVDAMRTFVDQNQCGLCYVAIRAYADRKTSEFLADGRHLVKAAMSSGSS